MKNYIVTFDTKENKHEFHHYYLIEAKNTVEAKDIAWKRWNREHRVMNVRIPHMFHVESKVATKERAIDILANLDNYNYNRFSFTYGNSINECALYLADFDIGLNFVDMLENPYEAYEEIQYLTHAYRADRNMVIENQKSHFSDNKVNQPELSDIDYIRLLSMRFILIGLGEPYLAVTDRFDILKAHKKYNLRLRDFLLADNFNFAHDFVGIRKNIDRNTGLMNNYFLPRFAGKQ